MSKAIARFNRDELATIAMALDEFRDTGVPEMAARINVVLQYGAGDQFCLAEADGPAEQLYRVEIEGGGSFLYDLTDVGRFVRRMIAEGDRRRITIRAPRKHRDPGLRSEVSVI